MYFNHTIFLSHNLTIRFRTAQSPFVTFMQLRILTPRCMSSWSLNNLPKYVSNYSDVTMSTMASQITVSSVCSTVCSGAENIKASRYWPQWGRHRWNPLTKGQWRGKCFHLMRSSWIRTHERTHWWPRYLLIHVWAGDNNRQNSIWRTKRYRVRYVWGYYVWEVAAVDIFMDWWYHMI